MPLYSIKAPDGQTYEIEGPAGASRQDVINEILRRNPDAGKPPKDSVLSDLGYSGLSGLGGVMQFPGQVYGLLGGDADNAMTRMGQAVQDYATSKQSSGLKARQAKQAQALQEAQEQGGVLGQASTAITSTLKDPILLGNFLAENVSNMLPGLGAAKGTVAFGMRSVAKELAAQGIEGEAKAAALKAARDTLAHKAEQAAVATGMAQQGADIGAQTYQDVYKKLIADNVPEEEAAAQALSLARGAGASAATISYLASRLPGARALERSFAGSLGVKGATIGAVKGALGEMASEAVEEGGGQLAHNAAMASVDPTQNLLNNVGQAAGMGAVLGGTMGGGAGYLNTNRMNADQAAQQQQQAAAEAEQQAAQQQQQEQQAAAEFEAKRKDPQFLSGLMESGDAYRTRINELKSVIREKGGKDDPLVMARKEQASEELDALLKSPEYQQHIEEAKPFAADVRSLRLQRAQDQQQHDTLVKQYEEEAHQAAEQHVAAISEQKAAEEEKAQAALQDPEYQFDLYKKHDALQADKAAAIQQIQHAAQTGDLEAMSAANAKMKTAEEQLQALKPQLGTRPHTPVQHLSDSGLRSRLVKLAGGVNAEGKRTQGALTEALSAGKAEPILREIEAVHRELGARQASKEEMAQRVADAQKQVVSPEPENPMADYMQGLAELEAAKRKRYQKRTIAVKYKQAQTDTKQSAEEEAALVARLKAAFTKKKPSAVERVSQTDEFKNILKQLQTLKSAPKEEVTPTATPIVLTPEQRKQIAEKLRAAFSQKKKVEPTPVSVPESEPAPKKRKPAAKKVAATTTEETTNGAQTAEAKQAKTQGQETPAAASGELPAAGTPGKAVETPGVKKPKASKKAKAAPDTAASPLRESRTSTPLHADTTSAVLEGDTAAVLKHFTATAASPEVKQRIAKIAPMLAATKIEHDAGLTLDGAPVAGTYNPKTNTITLRSEGLTEEDLLHEMVHAATDRALLLPEKDLTDDQRAAKRELEAMRVMVSALPKFSSEHIHNVREFAAEVYTNKELRDKLDTTGKPLTLLQRIARIIQRLLGWGTPTVTQSARAASLVERLLMPSQKLEAETAASPLRTKAAEGVQAVKDKLTSENALRAEYTLADMHVYAVEAMRKVGGNIGQQAEFDIRAAGAPSILAEAAIQHGALEKFTDSKGYSALRATKKDAGAEVFKAVQQVPGADPQAKFDAVTEYMKAIRGLRVGPQKVGTYVSRAELQAIVDKVRSDPKTYKAMENVREKYNAFNNKMVQMLVDTGVFSAEDGRYYTEHGDYIPMYREHEGKLQAVMDGRYETIGDIAHTPFMHALKGGKERVLPLNETIFMNTELLVKMALVNTAKANIAKGLSQAGKQADKMQIVPGAGASNKETLKWRENGKEYHLVMDTEGTPLSGIPTAMLAQSIEGYHATLPQTLMWMQKANDMLRAGITRMPMYTVRQLVKDPAAAAIMRGMDGGPLAAVTRAFKEYGKAVTGKNEGLEHISRLGLVQNSQFTGNPDDMQALAKQMAGGDAPNAIRKLLTFLDKSSSAANATTQLQLYKDGLKKGMSEIEAVHHAREAMNFHKRGASASIQQLNRTLVFFNSGIQALNVLQNTLRKRMPFEERLNTQQKFVHNAMMLFIGGVLYGAAMGGDDEYDKLRMRDKMGNLHIPLGDTFLKLPISYFEAGGGMWAAGQGLAALAFSDTDSSNVFKALGQYALTALPGGGGLPVGPGIKQVGEWATNKDFSTFRDIVPASKTGLAPSEQVGPNTPDALRMAGAAFGVSPLKMQHALDSLFGSALTAGLQALDQITQLGDSARPARGLEETPFVGSLFQNKNSSEAMDEMYEAANNAAEVRKTLAHMQSEGRSGADIQKYIADNKETLAIEKVSGEFKQRMSALTKSINQIEASAALSAEQKQERIDKLKSTKMEIAEAMNKARRAALERLS